VWVYHVNCDWIESSITKEGRTKISFHFYLHYRQRTDSCAAQSSGGGDQGATWTFRKTVSHPVST